MRVKEISQELSNFSNYSGVKGNNPEWKNAMVLVELRLTSEARLKFLFLDLPSVLQPLLDSSCHMLQKRTIK